MTANTIATLARLPLVMNCLVPFNTQAPPSSTARVFRLCASEPACGSVRQKQPIASSLRHVGKIAPLLLVGAEFEDGAAADGAVHAHQGGGGGAAGGDFLDGQGVGDVIGVGAAPFVRHHHAEQAQFAQLGDGRHRQSSRPLSNWAAWGAEFLAREIPRGIANHALFVGVEVRPPLSRPRAWPVSRKL